MKPRGGKREGAGRKSAKDETKILTLMNLCVDWATKEMKKDTSPVQKEIVLKVLSRAVPQEQSIDTNIQGSLTIQWKEQLPSTTPPETGQENSTQPETGGTSSLPIEEQAKP